MSEHRKPGQKYLMISAVAERFEIHPQTLRLYEREGLIIAGPFGRQHPPLRRALDPPPGDHPHPDPRPGRQPGRGRGDPQHEGAARGDAARARPAARAGAARHARPRRRRRAPPRPGAPASATRRCAAAAEQRPACAVPRATPTRGRVSFWRESNGGTLSSMWDPLLRDISRARAQAADEPLEDACPHCEGRGWVIASDGGAGTARPCGCRQEGREERLLAAAGIPERYRRCSLGRFNAKSPDPGARRQLQQAMAVSRRYVEEFVQPGGGFRESGLLYVGPPGVGKTHLAVAVLGRADRDLPGARALRRLHLADPPDPVDLRSRLARVEAADPRPGDRGRGAGARRARCAEADRLGAATSST